MNDQNSLFKNATVTIPYNDFQKALEPKEHDDPLDDPMLKKDIDYINVLVRDVATGMISMAEAQDFYLFKTPLGQVILDKIQDYKGL